jgi:hypothetical protein
MVRTIQRCTEPKTSNRNINVAANSSYLASAVQRLQNFTIWERTQKKDVEKE